MLGKPNGDEGDLLLDNKGDLGLDNEGDLKLEWTSGKADTLELDCSDKNDLELDWTSSDWDNLEQCGISRDNKPGILISLSNLSGRAHITIEHEKIIFLDMCESYNWPSLMMSPGLMDNRLISWDQ